ncbi:hypothetical protein HAX54_004068 [Datura stramonium]|uniref:Uncharacterized protein n=1 Tax=Datura stramonium TaxID=4076 RepID=A0ABS8T6F0_DATST|nr:hypothetical protein [Datura stramonium]
MGLDPHTDLENFGSKDEIIDLDNTNPTQKESPKKINHSSGNSQNTNVIYVATSWNESAETKNKISQSAMEIQAGAHGVDNRSHHDLHAHQFSGRSDLPIERSGRSKNPEILHCLSDSRDHLSPDSEKTDEEIAGNEQLKVHGNFPTVDGDIQATPKPKNQHQQERKEETITTILKSPSTDLNLSESIAMAISGHGGGATPEQQLGNFQTGVVRPHPTKVNIQRSPTVMDHIGANFMNTPSSFTAGAGDNEQVTGKLGIHCQQVTTPPSNSHDKKNPPNSCENLSKLKNKASSYECSSGKVDMELFSEQSYYVREDLLAFIPSLVTDEQNE